MLICVIQGHTRKALFCLLHVSATICFVGGINFICQRKTKMSFVGLLGETQLLSF